MSLSFEVRDAGPVRLIAWTNREHRNAFDPDDRARLADLVDAATVDGVRALILHGTDGTFSAGGDIRSMTTDTAVAAPRLDDVTHAIRAVAQASFPVLTAVEGSCFGFGLALAAVSDHVVAAEDATFCCPFPHLGLAADGGLHHSLPRRVGNGRAGRMLLFAERVDAVRAESWGLVDRLTPSGSALDAAREAAEVLTTLAPGSLAAAKRITRSAGSLADALAAEKQTQLDLIRTADFAEGTAAFLARRRPEFTGR